MYSLSSWASVCSCFVRCYPPAVSWPADNRKTDVIWSDHALALNLLSDQVHIRFTAQQHCLNITNVLRETHSVFFTFVWQVQFVHLNVYHALKMHIKITDPKTEIIQSKNYKQLFSSQCQFLRYLSCPFKEIWSDYDCNNCEHSSGAARHP